MIIKFYNDMSFLPFIIIKKLNFFTFIFFFAFVKKESMNHRSDGDNRINNNRKESRYAFFPYKKIWPKNTIDNSANHYNYNS